MNLGIKYVACYLMLGLEISLPVIDAVWVNLGSSSKAKLLEHDLRTEHVRPLGTNGKFSLDSSSGLVTLTGPNFFRLTFALEWDPVLRVRYAIAVSDHFTALQKWFGTRDEFLRRLHQSVIQIELANFVEPLLCSVSSVIMCRSFEPGKTTGLHVEPGLQMVCWRNYRVRVEPTRILIDTIQYPLDCDQTVIAKALKSL